MKTDTKQEQSHTLLQSIVLHLMPGVVIGGSYFLLVQPVVDRGYPTIFSLIVVALVVLVPLLLLIIFLLEKDKIAQDGFKSLFYHEPLKPHQYVIYVILILVLSAGVFVVLSPLGLVLEDTLFSFFPEHLKIQAGLTSDYTANALWITYISGFFVIVLLAPFIEELYFRGYLLPRMPRMKGYYPLVHTFLFAIYHIWTPWMFITRTLGILPVAYFVDRKQNLWIGIIAHALLNSLDIITGLVFIATLT